MLDKNKIYTGYSKPYRGKNQPPSKKFKRVKILYEDDISFYVESLTEKDQRGFGKRYSAKKHCFHFIEVGTNRTPDHCINCPLYKAALRITK